MTPIDTAELERLAESITRGPWIYYADLPSVEPNWHIVTTANKMRVLANVHIEPGNVMDEANARAIALVPALISEVLAHRKAEAWQPISTAPFGKAGDPSTYFIGARQDGKRVNTATCYRNKHGAYEWWGGGLTPTHWMPIPHIGSPCPILPPPLKPKEAAMRSNVIDLDVQVLHETDKAAMVTLDVPDNGVWLPKSQIELNETGIAGIMTVTLPEWLALDKGLI